MICFPGSSKLKEKILNLPRMFSLFLPGFLKFISQHFLAFKHKVDLFLFIDII